MKPPRFQYIRAETPPHALELIATLGEDAKVIAGGQSLVPLMSLRLARPSHLVDVGGLTDLSGIRTEPGGAVQIGATTLQRTIETSADLAATCPLLPFAVGHIGHVAIRNRGTLGGSVAHGDPASELPLCLVALDAQVVIERSSGCERVVPAHDLFLGWFTTAIEADELLTEVRIPRWPSGAGWGFHEFGRRHGDFAVVAVAAILQIGSDGAVTDSRIAVAGVGSTPMRARNAEALLHGQSPDRQLFEAAGAEVARFCSPHSDLHGTADFRRRLAAVLTERALVDALARAELR